MRLKNVDIIFLALARWDGPYSSTAYSIALELSKNQRVFYIDNPFTLKDIIANYKTPNIRKRWLPLLFGKKKYTKIQDNLIAVTPGAVFPINFLPKGMIYSFFQRINNVILVRTMKKLIKEHQISDYILINSFNPFYLFSIPKTIKPLLYVYQSVDDINKSKYVNKHGLRLENEILKIADLCIVTSTKLWEEKKKIKKNTYLIPNAADFNLFEKAQSNNIEKPSEIKNWSGKIVCYTGNIDSRLDFKLLLKIAKSLKNQLILMIGPNSIIKSTNNEEKSVAIEFFNQPNVLLTGRKDISQLPDYLQYASCAIIPFKCNELTESIYPLKINEYLAAAKPVVSTAFSKDIMDFNTVAKIANSHEEFILGIKDALNNPDLQKIKLGIDISRSNNWTSRVNHFYDIITDNINSYGRK